MADNNINNYFFVINPKSMLYGKKLENLAINANRLAGCYKNINVFMTAPFTELNNIVKKSPNLIITAQHVDNVNYGESMGTVSIDSLHQIGVKAVVLNHAEKPLTISSIDHIIKEAKNLNIYTIVCASSVAESKSIAMLEPDIILAEPTELIGGVSISNDEYIISTINEIKRINPRILVEQGAGIRTGKDVKHMLDLGADGVGVTSGIIKSNNPIETTNEMIKIVGTYK